MFKIMVHNLKFTMLDLIPMHEVASLDL